MTSSTGSSTPSLFDAATEAAAPDPMPVPVPACAPAPGHAPALGQAEFDRLAAPVPRWVAESPLGSNARAFWEHHLEHPGVYRLLRQLAFQAVRAGATRLGMKNLYEVARWNRMMEGLPESDDQFRLNNNWTGMYARLLMENEPTLAGLFETRELRSSTPHPGHRVA